MRLALVQQRARPNSPAHNLAYGVELCEASALAGADLVVFPELWQTAYRPPTSQSGGLHPSSDVQVDEHAWLEGFGCAAKRLGISVVVTYVEHAHDTVRNAAAVIDPDGAIAHVHRKVHLCDFGWESVFQAGADFGIVDVPVGDDRVQLGVMICFDREFSESARSLRLAGAELIVCPNACLLCDDRIGHARALAFENVTAIAIANYPMPLMNGRSCVFDGISMHMNRPRDHRLVEAGPRPELVLADIDLERLRTFRDVAIWQPYRRRPDVYAETVGT